MKSPVYRAKTCQPGHPLSFTGKSAKKVDPICPLGYSFSFSQGGGLKVTFPLMDSEPAGKQSQAYETKRPELSFTLGWNAPAKSQANLENFTEGVRN